jgi:hypothetical protein
VPPVPIVVLLVAVELRVITIFFMPFSQVPPVLVILIMIPTVPIIVILVTNSHLPRATGTPN